MDRVLGPVGGRPEAAEAGGGTAAAGAWRAEVQVPDVEGASPAEDGAGGVRQAAGGGVAPHDEAAVEAGAEGRGRSVIREVTPAASPATRRASARPQARGSSAESGASLPSPGAASFDDFKRRWSRFLNKSQLRLCEVVFAETEAKGLPSYETDSRVLAKQLGVTRRYVFDVVSQVEELGFLERERLEEGKRPLGIKLWFFSTPKIR